MPKKKVILRTVPRISRIRPVIDGKKIDITVSRSSKICKWLKVPFLVVWNRVYVRDSVVTKKIFDAILLEIGTQRQQGLLQTIKEFLFR